MIRDGEMTYEECVQNEKVRIRNEYAPLMVDTRFKGLWNAEIEKEIAHAEIQCDLKYPDVIATGSQVQTWLKEKHPGRFRFYFDREHYMEGHASPTGRDGLEVPSGHVFFYIDGRGNVPNPHTHQLPTQTTWEAYNDFMLKVDEITAIARIRH